MTPREHLHRLVEDLPESEVPTAERVLSALAETATESLYTLDDAPVDDEPESEEERRAVAEAWQEHRAGEGLTTEEVKRRLGLA